MAEGDDTTLSSFAALADRGQNKFSGLEIFPLPSSVASVDMASAEVTAKCPVTGQPDFYEVDIELVDSRSGIESKSLKLYLQSYREVGSFCEALADKILRDVVDATDPGAARVILHQKPRGGIAIRAEARYDQVTGYGL
jgi:7-cyano-7-deazaguanine reductase